MLSIRVLTRKVRDGWRGVIRVYRGDRCLWSETVDVTRLSAEDALADALRLKDEYLLRV
jgi:hypothetical protein